MISSKKKRVRKYDQFLLWLFGKSVYHHELQKLPNRLAVNLNFATMTLSTVYIFWDIILGVHGPIVTSIVLAVGGSVGILLFRFGYIVLAKTLVLLVYFFAIYLGASANVYHSGTHLYFLALGLAGFVIFGYEKIQIGIAFSLLAIGLYFLSYFSDYSILPKFNMTHKEVYVFFIINVSSFSIISIIVLLAYMRMMYKQSDVIQQKNYDLVKTNKELDQFLYTTSHDLRAPLATILGLLNITRNTDDLKEKQYYESLMETSIFKMEEFIEDIIHFFKNSRLPIQSEEISPNKLVKGLFEELENQANLKEVDLRICQSSDEQIIGDQMRIKNILRNLISNGIKYSDPSKENKYVEVSILPNGETIEFSVKDNGIGIEEIHMDKVFNMFYRASENSKGSGLGLYIAHETAQNLGGELKAESVESNGSIFFLRLAKDNSRT